MNIQPGIGNMQPGFNQILPKVKRPFPKLKKTTVRTLSGFCIAFGVASICIQIAALVIYAEEVYDVVFFEGDVSGHGIWAGTFYIIAGSLGLAACHKPALSLLVTTIVFSALSALAAIASATLAGISAGRGVGYNCYYNYNYNYNPQLCDAWWALEWTLMSIAIISFMLSVPLLVLACVALCGRPKMVNMMTAPGVMYIGNSGQQMFYQQPQQVQMTQQQPFQVFYSPQPQQPAVFQPNPVQLTVKQPEMAQVELEVRKDEKPKLENSEN